MYEWVPNFCLFQRLSMPVLTLISKSGAMSLNLNFFGGKRNIRRKEIAGECRWTFYRGDAENNGYWNAILETTKGLCRIWCETCEKACAVERWMKKKSSPARWGIRSPNWWHDVKLSTFVTLLIWMLWCYNSVNLMCSDESHTNEQTLASFDLNNLYSS